MTLARGITLAVAVAATVVVGPSSSGTASICAGPSSGERPRHVILEGRAYDLVIDAVGRYVVASSNGVIAVDACTLTVVAGCHDPSGARTVDAGEDGRIVYTRPDGTARACDLSSGRDEPLRRGSNDAPHPAARVAWIEGERAWTRGPRGEPYPLAGSDEALAVAIDPNGTGVAVADRRGHVTLYSSSGLYRGHYRAHARNAYGLAWDGANRRIVTVGGAGELTLRSTAAR